MVCVLVTLMLPGRFFLLTLLYLAAKDVPFGKVTFNGTVRRVSTIFLSHLLFLLARKTFFNIGLASLPRNGAVADARSSVGKPHPFVFDTFFVSFFSYCQCTRHLFLQIGSHSFQIFVSLVDCICSVF